MMPHETTVDEDLISGAKKVEVSDAIILFSFFTDLILKVLVILFEVLMVIFPWLQWTSFVVH